MVGIPKYLDDFLDRFRTPEERVEHRAEKLYRQILPELERQHPKTYGWVLVDTATGSWDFFAKDELRKIPERALNSGQVEQLYLMEHGKDPDLERYSVLARPLARGCI